MTRQGNTVPTAADVPAYTKKNISFSVGLQIVDYLNYSNVTRIWCGYYGYELNVATDASKIRKFHIDGNNDVTLYDWHQISEDIPSFYKDYSTLQSLSEAAGASYAYHALHSAADFNDYTHTGVVLVYTVAITAGIQNAPTGIAYGYLEVLRIIPSGERIRQRYYQWGYKSFMAYRYYENDSWGAWKYD